MVKFICKVCTNRCKIKMKGDVHPLPNQCIYGEAEVKPEWKKVMPLKRTIGGNNV